MRGAGVWTLLMTLLSLPVMVSAQGPAGSVERSLALPASRESGIEVRVWVKGAARVSTLYRMVKTDTGVSDERFALADVVRAEQGGYTVSEARRETTANRKLIAQERCDGKVIEGVDHLVPRCRTA